jgi:Tfp pilus assembly protein PilP
MAKKKSSGIAKKVAIVGIPLIIIQVGYMMLWQKSDPRTMQQAIEKVVSKVSKADERRKALLRIQLSIRNYMENNDNRPPASLDELRPKYFDVIPVDPVTNKPFEYKVENNRPVFVIAEYQGTPKGGTVPAETTAAPQSVLPEVEQIAFVYDASNKRDPFRPFDFAPRPTSRTGKTPLERYEYGQLKLTAVLEGLGEAQAIIENAVGRGFTAKKGTKVGPYGGEIVEILKDKVLILENTVDFTGERKSKTVELRLRTRDQERKAEELNDGMEMQ